MVQTFGLDHDMYQFFSQEEKERGHLAVLWKACAVVGGMYLFYLFELLLRRLTGQSHSHELNVSIILDGK